MGYERTPGGKGNAASSGSGVATVANVKDATYGAKGDGIRRYDATIAAGTLGTMTSATGTFTSADVGKLIAISGAGNTGGFTTTETHITTIATVVNATTITLTANAVRAVSAQTYTYGTDDAAAITAAVNAVLAAGTATKTVYFPVGLYCTSAVLPTLDSSVDITLRGAGGRMGAGTSSKFNNRGSMVGPSTSGVLVTASSEVCFIGHTSSNFAQANDAIGFAVENLSLRYHSSDFYGALVKLGSTNLWGYLHTLRDSQFAGVDQTTVNASAALDVNGGSAGGGIETLVLNCTFQNAQRGIKGQCNQFTMIGGHIADYVIGGYVNPGLQSTFLGVVFENGISSGGKSNPAIISASGQGSGDSLTVSGCSFWDQWGTGGFVIDYYGNNLQIRDTLFYLVGTGTIVRHQADAPRPKGLTFRGNDLSKTTTAWTLFSLPLGVENYDVGSNVYDPTVITNGFASVPLPTSPVRTGSWVPAVPVVQSGGVSPRTLAGGFQGYGEAWPFKVANTCKVTDVALEVVVAGAATNDLRLALYADTGAFYPGAKILELGTITGSTAAVVQFNSLTQQLQADTTYWWMLVAQGTGAQPTIRASLGSIDLGRLSTALTAESGNPNCVFYVQAIAAGALPATAPTGMDGINLGTVPRVLLKIA